MARVFLSSVYTGLEDYRVAAFQAITDAGHVCVGMEGFDPSDETRMEGDAREVRTCEIFIIFVGRWYGSLGPDGKTSYTEIEFNAAKDARLTILPFYLEKGAPGWAADPPEEAGRDLTYQRDARDELVRKINRGMRAVPVKGPDDFKYRLSKALVVLDPKPKPRVNAMIAKLCDRTDQNEDFADLFNAPGRFVNIYVLFGRDPEQHSSCVERLICRYVLEQKPAGELQLLAPALPDRRFVEWPTRRTDPVEIVFNRLRRRLFLATDDKYPFAPSDEARGLVDLASSLGVPHLVFRHVVQDTAFDEMTKQCIGLYLDFWDRVAAVAKSIDKRVRVLVFFQVICSDPAAMRPVLESLFPPGGSEGCYRAVLPELESVTGDHLQTWWAAYGRYVKTEYYALGVGGNFPHPPVPMRDVELKLREIIGL